MALKTDTNANENLVFNDDFSRFIEHGQILLLNEPVVVYARENMENDCAIVLDSLSEGNSRLQEIVFDGDYYQFGNFPSNSFPSDIRNVNERQRVDEGLTVLEILCNDTHAADQPEFVDVNRLPALSKFDRLQPNVDAANDGVLPISDDDDVVFVKEYKNSEEPTKKVEETKPRAKSAKGIRRNPVRKVRTRSRDLSKEHIFEEDFAFLDTSEEDAVDAGPERKEKENQSEITATLNGLKAPSEKTASQKDTSEEGPPKRTPVRRAAAAKGKIKQWPVNAHERPKYNAETKKIEAFDYNVRENGNKKPAAKKPRLETVVVRRKSNKKYVFTRQRKPAVVPVQKFYASELKPLVDSTTEMLRNFFVSKKRPTTFPIVRDGEQHVRSGGDSGEVELKNLRKTRDLPRPPTTIPKSYTLADPFFLLTLAMISPSELTPQYMKKRQHMKINKYKQKIAMMAS
ncbi:hypothetical protein NQ318_003277 [Aromia moschata]|uniref:Uncharacterized protein n=1 Tax=Aromia moschata TaxID=1265417 RepID=A0AAV8YNK8_9CUCU|nr:hypothetical protein NQ318_003277 [Aromia moschata]